MSVHKFRDRWGNECWSTGGLGYSDNAISQGKEDSRSAFERGLLDEAVNSLGSVTHDGITFYSRNGRAVMRLGASAAEIIGSQSNAKPSERD